MATPRAATPAGSAADSSDESSSRSPNLSSPSRSALTSLWQWPLLLLALGMFGYAAYLFIDPKAGLTVSQRMATARDLLNHDRPEAAIEHLNKLLAGEKLVRDDEAMIHLQLAEALDAGQRLNKINNKVNYQQIIEQTRLALAQGARASADTYRRLGESYESLEMTSDALDNYRRAMQMDPTRSLHLQRKVIDLQLAMDDPGPAEASLDVYLKDEKLANSERAWAVSQKADLLMRRGNYIEARVLVGEAMRLDTEPTAQGTGNYRLGVCAFRNGDAAEAERLLRVARDQLKIGNPLDAEAAYLLGKISQEKGAPREAISFYDIVLTSHPGSRPAPLARLGRGVARLSLGDDPGGLTDLHDVTDEIMARASRQKYKADVVAGLRDASHLLAGRANYQGAVEVLGYEQVLDPEPPADFYGRLASVYERRADQLGQAKLGPDSTPADALRRDEQMRQLRTHAGDSYIAFSRAVTLTDDKAHGEAMWRGVDLYDQAGNLPQAIGALELFVAERPEDRLTPDALLRLGSAYQAAGQFDKAIAAFGRNQFRYPTSLAASRSGVPLAKAYIAKGPDQYPKAEKVLLGVMESPLVRPDAEEFHQALFELSQLFYRSGRYEEAVSRLQEMVDRYPKDPRMGQLLFLMADSYRKSASLLTKMTAAPGLASASAAEGPGAAVADVAEAAAARRERLAKARVLFDRVIDLYQDGPPAHDLERVYQKLSYFYRADCVYDLGQYEDAIKLYDAATLRYQDDPAAVAAYVQIVNSYVALGKVPEARTANERARQLLDHIPANAFNGDAFSMPKEYWEQWLKWTSESGIWSGRAGDPATRPTVPFGRQ